MSGTEFTPTTDEVREAVDEWVWSRRMFRPELASSDVAEFDRWLAEHDREVAAKALTDAAEHITDDYLKRALLARAAALGVPEEAEHV